MLSRALVHVLAPLILLGSVFGGCAGLPGEKHAVGGTFGETTVFAEETLPIVTHDGTAVAGWIGHVVGITPEDAPATPVSDGIATSYRLDSGDKLRIFVYAQPSLSRIYTVDNEGLISVPLIGNVHARGTTTRALEGAIAGRLGAEFVRDPHVTVDIQQYRPFFILGEVKSAGQYPYVSGLTVDAAVAIAGGFSERANERKVQITRRMRDGIEKLEVPGDSTVRPGDTIYVKERWF